MIDAPLTQGGGSMGLAILVKPIHRLLGPLKNDHLNNLGSSLHGFLERLFFVFF